MNSWKPQSEADRHQASYRPVPGSRRGGSGNYTQSRQAVELEGGEFAEAQRSIEEEILLELRAIRVGISLMVDDDLLARVLSEAP